MGAGGVIATAELEVVRSRGGQFFARRIDGERLTSADKKLAVRLITEGRELRRNLIAEVYSVAGALQAALIYSTVLDARVWIVFEPGAVPPTDRLAQYQAHELPPLAGKTDEQLRAIQAAKTAFPGAKVIR